jgi:hypothetical protein
MKVPNVGIPSFVRPADGFAFFLGLGSALLFMLHFFSAPGALEHYSEIKAAARDRGLNPRFAAAVVDAASGGRPGARAANGRWGLMAACGDACEAGTPRSELASGCEALAKAALAQRYEPRLVLFAHFETPSAVAERTARLPQLSAEEIVERCALPATRAFIDRVYEAWTRFEPDPPGR